MPNSELLNAFQSELKRAIVTDMENSFERLFEVVSDSSDRKNELYMLSGQYNQAETQFRKGIIDYDDQVLIMNKVRNSMLEYIDDLKLTDFNEKASPEIAQYLASLAEAPKEKVVVKESPVAAANPQPRAFEAPEGPPQVTRQITMIDLELLSETERSLLTRYPVVYRQVRAIIFRGGTNNPDAVTAYNTIIAKKEILRAYNEFLQPIETNIRNIRMKAEDKTFDILYRKFKDIASRLSLDNIDSLHPELPGLQDLHQRLAAGGWL